MDGLIVLLASLTAMALMVIGALHLFWAAGGEDLLDATVPQRPPATGLAAQVVAETSPEQLPPDASAPVLQKVFVPSARGTAIVGFGLFGASAALLLAITGRGWMGQGAVILTGVLAVLFLARAIGDGKWVGWTKRVRGTPFARMDDKLYTPLSAFFGATCAITVLWSVFR